MKSKKKRAIFLDRDGVLIKNIDGDYLKSSEQIEVFEGVEKSLSKLKRAGYLLIIITNQAAVSKGLMTLEKVIDLNNQVVKKIDSNNILNISSYICPHQTIDLCFCRKPQPGLIFKAAREFNISLSKSYMIGDAISDIDAAKNGNVRPIMVLSGRGDEENERFKYSNVPILKCINEAAHWILKEGKNV